MKLFSSLFARQSGHLAPRKCISSIWPSLNICSSLFGSRQTDSSRLIRSLKTMIASTAAAHQLAISDSIRSGTSLSFLCPMKREARDSPELRCSSSNFALKRNKNSSRFHFERRRPGRTWCQLLASLAVFFEPRDLTSTADRQVEDHVSRVCSIQRTSPMERMNEQKLLSVR